MALQPVGDRHSRTVRQQVDWASAFEIDEQRAIGSSLADGPIVDAHGARRIHSRQRQAVHEAQDRIRAGLHTQMAGQARAGLATDRKPDPGLGLGKATGPSRSRRHQPREWLSEGPAAAGAMMAVKASNAQAQRHGLTDAREIGRMAFIAAVNGSAGRAAGRTSAMNTTRMGDDDETTAALDDALDRAARQG